MHKKITFILIALVLASQCFRPSCCQSSPSQKIFDIMGIAPSKNVVEYLLGEIETRKTQDFIISCPVLTREEKDRYYFVDNMFACIMSLRILESAPPNRSACIDWISRLQNPDGGFDYGEFFPDFRISNESDAIPTFHAVLSLLALGSSPQEKGRCIEFLLNETYFPQYIVLPLYCLGYAEDDVEPLRNIANRLSYLFSLKQNPDGGFSWFEDGLPPDVETTFWATCLNTLLGDPPLDVKKSIEFLRSCQTDLGGFASTPNDPGANLKDTYRAVIALKRLGSTPHHTDECAQYVLKNNNADGGFSDDPGWSDIEDTFYAVATLANIGTISEAAGRISLLHMFALGALAVAALLSAFLLFRLRMKHQTKAHSK